MNNIPDFQKIGKDLIKDVQTIAEVEMINFVMQNFEKQAWQGTNVEPWDHRKGNTDTGRALLVQSGALRDSIKVTESTGERVVVSSSSKYAAIHNEGGMVNIVITKKMRKFFWAMYYKTKRQRWKAMALTKKKQISFKMPKRQFMGDSMIFNNHIEDLFIKTITQRFKQHLNTN